ncbi:OadG family protein [Bacteroidota bacterium]
MDDHYNLALMLLAVGMITVFVILSLVVVSGNILIRFINKFFPESIKNQIIAGSDFSNKKLAAIIGAIDIITSGKGKIQKIEKLNKD